jgi:restriction system protein
VTKKQDSLLEELLKAFYHAPLWVAPIGIGVIYITGELVIPAMLSSSTIGRVFGPLSKTVTLWLCGAILLAAVLGAAGRALRRFRDGALFNRQSGIESIRSLSWQDFERMVGEAYRRQGYEVQTTPGGADGGVDLILSRDGQRAYVQCKQWRKVTVGVEVVRQFKGAMAAAGVAAGFFVSSGRFTVDAEAFANQTGITPVDGPALERLVKGFQPKPAQMNALSGTEPRGCPRCGSKMVRRTARRGEHTGKDFLGCSRYPACKGTRALA